MTTSTARTAVITGANSGIGEATATALATQGWQVYATARSRARGQAAVERIRRASGSDAVELLELDLASFASVRSAADELLGRTDSIDVLINNAGVILSERTTTEDGLESTMQVNHFGPFLFTSLLLPTVLQSADARVVNVSSIVHQRTDHMPLDDLQLERQWGRIYPYAVSKLANILFTRELHRRYDPQRLASFAVHPGAVRTGFGQDGDIKGIMGRVFSVLQFAMMTPVRGAAPVVELAVRADRREHAGAYFNRHRQGQPSEVARDDETALRLWERSDEITQAEWPSHD